MPTKKQKQAVIRQLLIPIILIIAALLYQPVKGLFVSKEKPVETKRMVAALRFLISMWDRGMLRLFKKETLVC